MLLEEVDVAEVAIPVILHDEIPHRVGAHAVEPVGQRILLCGQVEAGIVALFVTEDGAAAKPCHSSIGEMLVR